MFFSQQCLNLLWKVGRCMQLEEIDGRKVKKKIDLSCFLAPGAERSPWALPGGCWESESYCRAQGSVDAV